MNIGVTPEPSRNKTQKGSMSINVKTKQKNPPPMGESIKPTTPAEKMSGAIPQTPTLENQQAQATYYTAQSVGQIFDTVVNIISARTGCTPLSQNERIALGEAWMPIFAEYFSGENSKWVMVAVITIPIALRILSEIQQKKKKKELEEQYGIKDIPKEQLPKKKSAWENMSHGENKTNKK